MTILQRKLLAAGFSGYRKEASEGTDDSLNINTDEGAQGDDEVSLEDQLKDALSQVQKLTDTVQGLTVERDKLAKNNSSLLDEKNEKARVAEQAKLEAAQKAGDVESVTAHWKEKNEQERNALQEQIYQRDEIILGGAADNEVLSLIGLFRDDAKVMAEMALRTMATADYSDDMKVIKTYRNEKGEVIGNDRETFIEYINTSPAFKGMLKAVDSGGGPREQHSKPGLGGPAIPDKPYSQMTTAEKTEYLKSKQGAK